jgi:hypothetical protein
MHTSQLIFEILAVIHGLGGAVLFVVALNKDFQRFCFYASGDAFEGGLRKNLALLGSLMLIVCGAFAFIRPAFAVGAAWLSFVIYLLPSVVHLMAGRPIGKFCKACAASFGVRAAAFAALALALLRGQHG